jgi:hypothetical protein
MGQSFVVISSYVGARSSRSIWLCLQQSSYLMNHKEDVSSSNKKDLTNSR